VSPLSAAAAQVARLRQSVDAASSSSGTASLDRASLTARTAVAAADALVRRAAAAVPVTSAGRAGSGAASSSDPSPRRLLSVRRSLQRADEAVAAFLAQASGGATPVRPRAVAVAAAASPASTLGTVSPVTPWQRGDAWGSGPAARPSPSASPFAALATPGKPGASPVRGGMSPAQALAERAAREWARRDASRASSRVSLTSDAGLGTVAEATVETEAGRAPAARQAAVAAARELPMEGLAAELSASSIDVPLTP